MAGGACGLADTDLLRRQQQANREAGTGPQLARDAMDTRFRRWQQAGRLAPDTDTYSLALLFCGSAQLRAYVEYLAGPEGLRGTREERTAALARALTSAARTASTAAQPRRGPESILGGS